MARRRGRAAEHELVDTEPTAQAQAIMERVLALVRECRLVLGKLEHPPKLGETSSAEAERILYYTLMSALDAGLIRGWRTQSRSCVTQASRLGPMGVEWLERQAQKLKEEDCTPWSALDRRCTSLRPA